MKILIVGAAGDIGQAACAELGQRHDLIRVGRCRGDVRIDVVEEGGSFTLTSGVLDRDPIPQCLDAATANGALAGFVTGAAIEMPRKLRINVVSPGVLEASQQRYGAWFPGFDSVPSDRVGRAYAKSVEGARMGQDIVVA